MFDYRNALKFGAKSRAEVSSFIADASNLLGAEKEKSDNVQKAIATVGEPEKVTALLTMLGVDVSGTSKETTRAVRAAYSFARASLLGALADKFSAIADNDNRKPEDFLKLSREMREIMETLKIDNLK